MAKKSTHLEALHNIFEENGISPDGARIGETIGIRWEDIDFEKWIISINGGFCLTSFPKSGYTFSMG